MIGYLRGKVLDCSDGKVLLAVGAPDGSSGVGYCVSTPRHASYDGLLVGNVVEFHIHTHVREDLLDLYGFLTKTEKDIFLTLLNVNGIGPKGALSILSGAEPSRLVRAILEGDTDFLVKIPGIGKKTAERVVLELADTVRKRFGSGALGGAAIAGMKGAARGGEIASSSVFAALDDAFAALVGLGYREQQASHVLSLVAADYGPSRPKAEDLVRSALKHLASV